MKKITLLALLIAQSTQGAAPVVHAYFAELYFKHCKPCYTQKERDAFLRGTLFPDIRYIASIPRTVTHKKDVTLDSIIATKSPFTAGLLFHTYVDEQRECIAQSISIYEHLKEVPYRYKALVLKTIEDEHTYSKLVHKTAITALRVFDGEERNYGIPIHKRMLWHRLLRNYFRQSPLTLLKERAQRGTGYLGTSPEHTAKMYRFTVKYVNDSKICSYVDKLMKDFEALLREHKSTV